MFIKTQNNSYVNLSQVSVFRIEYEAISYVDVNAYIGESDTPILLGRYGNHYKAEEALSKLLKSQREYCDGGMRLFAYENIFEMPKNV